MQSAKKALIIFGIYTLLTAALTWPWVAKFQTQIFGYYGDGLVEVWRFWNLNLKNPFSDTTVMVDSPTTLFAGQILDKLFGEVFAYNLLLFISFPLAGLTAYLLANYICKEFKTLSFNDREKQNFQHLEIGISLPSFLAGMVFTFSQYHFWHATQHLGLSAVQWLPLVILAFLKLTEKQTFKRILFFSSTLALTTLENYYYGFAMVIVLALPAILAFKQCGKKGRLVLSFASGGLLAGTMITPFLVKIIKNGSGAIAFSQSLNDLFRLTARPWDYLLPSINHPLFGKYVANFYQNINPSMSWQAWSAYLPERAIFIGYAALVLAAFGVFSAIKMSNSKTQVRKCSMQISKLIIIITLLSLWLSLPPYVSIHENIIPTSPSYFLFKIFPMFRAYIRFAVLVQLGVAVMAGVGFQYVTHMFKNSWEKRIRTSAGVTSGAEIILAGLIIFAIAFENLSFPIPFTKVNQIPPMYQYVRGEGGVTKIAEFPWDHDPTGDCGGKGYNTTKQKGYNYTYSLNFQRLHQKEVFFPTVPQEKAGSLLSKDTYQLLKDNGVTHVLAHTKDYFENPKNILDNCQPYRFYQSEPEFYEGFKKIVEFGDGIIYSL